MLPLKDNIRYLVNSTATTVLIILNCIFFVIEQALILSGHGAWVQNFGMWTPRDITLAFVHANPLYMLLNVGSILTATFLHGGWEHIMGNMVFLHCFGRAVEARLGVKRYVWFYLAGGFAAFFGQYIINVNSPIPNLGASGAIAAVLGAYLVLFPKARIMGASTSMGFLNVPAYWFLPLWAFSQVQSQLFEKHGGGGVAYMAHIGGFVFGLLFAWYIRKYRGGGNTKAAYIIEECAARS
jgi:membrane associated rhomboid family serine protease